jgi:hypothetical protein
MMFLTVKQLAVLLNKTENEMKTYKQEAQFVSSGDILQFGEKGKEWREVVLDNIKVTSEDVSIETYVPSQIDIDPIDWLFNRHTELTVVKR